MDAESLDAGMDMKQDQPGDNRTDLRTSDFYRVDENLPKRFNHPDYFKGYSKKSHPLYQTTNQLYGSKKPTVHEMPTSFHGSRSKFSDLILKTGTFRDNGFNTSVEKSRITGPNDISKRQDRIIFHHSYHTGGNDQAETNTI